jgi:hypothetical protein
MRSSSLQFYCMVFNCSYRSSFTCNINCFQDEYIKILVLHDKLKLSRRSGQSSDILQYLRNEDPLKREKP